MAALCNICTCVSVTTKTDLDETATRLTFARDGHVAKRTPVSRSTGTTVSLSGLFANMPVRVKELSKNKKRELARTVSLLQGYAVSAVGVRVVCTHIPAPTTGSGPKPGATSGKREELICTEGGTLRENVARIFGGEFARSLMEFKCVVPSGTSILSLSGSTLSQHKENTHCGDTSSELYEESTANESVVADATSTTTTIISTLEGLITKGAGRTAQDRQLFFLNGRPVDLPRIAKLINTTYHTILGQSKQSQRFFQYPSFVLTLTAPPGTFDINITPDKRTVLLHNEDAIAEALKEDLTKVWEPLLSTFEQGAGGSLLKLSPAVAGIKRFNQLSQSAPQLQGKRRRLLSSSSSSTLLPNFDESANNDSNDYDEDATDKEDSDEGRVQKSSRTNAKLSRRGSKKGSIISCEKNVEEFQTCRISGSMKRSSSLIKLGDGDEETCLITDEEAATKKSVGSESGTQEIVVSTVGIKFCDAVVESLLSKVKAVSSSEAEGSEFECRVGVDDDAKCVEELTKALTKQKLGELEVIGQFNLGFIIARDGPDLFIVDQHASDEIYNFEALQKTTSLNVQPLLAPVALELSAEDVVLVESSLEVFRRHGLILTVEKGGGSDGNAEKGSSSGCVKLVSCAYSKGTSFGMNDVYELIALLREFPGETTADNMLSRVRAMFASRACRKSVMIGTALGTREMKRILEHLATLDKPWRCPHGRPTIRHLVNLAHIRNMRRLES